MCPKFQTKETLPKLISFSAIWSKVVDLLSFFFSFFKLASGMREAESELITPLAAPWNLFSPFPGLLNWQLHPTS